VTPGEPCGRRREAGADDVDERPIAEVAELEELELVATDGELECGLE